MIFKIYQNKASLRIRGISTQDDTMVASVTYFHITTYHYNEFAKVTGGSNAPLSRL